MAGLTGTLGTIYAAKWVVGHKPHVTRVGRLGREPV